MPPPVCIVKGFSLLVKFLFAANIGGDVPASSALNIPLVYYIGVKRNNTQSSGTQTRAHSGGRTQAHKVVRIWTRFGMVVKATWKTLIRGNDSLAYLDN